VPGSRHRGDTVRIGEDADTAVLEKDEWNVLVEVIPSGELRRLQMAAAALAGSDVGAAPR